MRPLLASSHPPETVRADWVQLISPVFNEGENIRTVYQRLQADKVPFDVLTFVYDLDQDTSLPFIAEIRERDPRVRAEKNLYGRGVVNALRWGFKHCRPGPVVVIMADNSDRTSIIPEMIALWRGGAAVVCPSRYMPGGIQRGGGLIKSTLSRTAGVSLKVLGFPTSDPTNNFKLYDGAWLGAQSIESVGGFEVALELCFKAFRAGRRVEELPTIWEDRTSGNSRFRLLAWLPKYLKWYVLSILEIVRRRLGGAPRSVAATN